MQSIIDVPFALCWAGGGVAVESNVALTVHGEMNVFGLLRRAALPDVVGMDGILDGVVPDSTGVCG